MTRFSCLLLMLALMLTGVTSACGKYGPPCGKYGPPQRIGTNANGVEAAAASPEAECEDEEKRP
jgi:hypothetical protein